MGWYPHNQGNGLDRVFHALTEFERAAPLLIRPVVVSSVEQPASRVRIVDESLSLPRRLAGIREVFETEKSGIDLVASHFALYAYPILGRLGELPYVVHFHGPWAAESRLEGAGRISVAAKRWVEGRVYRRADRIIVLSTSFRRILETEYRIPPARIEVIPGGVDLVRFGAAPSRAEARSTLGWPGDRPIVLSVRRLVNRVGVDNLVSAVAQIRKEVPDVLVLIAGRGPLESVLQQQIEELGLSDHVSLVGFVPEEHLPMAYAAADLSVVPSVGLEGFGLIAAESLAAGTPAVVTPVGGLPEVVTGLSADLVCDGTSAASIADRIIALLRGHLPLPSGRDCREFARRNYDWEDVVRRTWSVYAGLIR